MWVTSALSRCLLEVLCPLAGNAVKEPPYLVLVTDFTLSLADDCKRHGQVAVRLLDLPHATAGSRRLISGMRTVKGG